MNITHRVEVRDFKIDGIRVRLHYNPTSGDVEIKATANVTDVVTGEPTTVNQHASVFADILSNHPDALADFIGRAVVDLVTHEVHEKLFINGKCWRNPHPLRLGDHRDGSPVCAIDRQAMTCRTMDGRTHEVREEEL